MAAGMVCHNSIIAAQDYWDRPQWSLTGLHLFGRSSNSNSLEWEKNQVNILEAGPGSPAWLQLAATLILILHIVAGSIGLISGSAALLFRKGARLHRISGLVFVGSMLVMSGIGACVAPFLPLPERATSLAGMLTFYLVVTAWLSVRRKQDDVGLVDCMMLLVSTSISVVAAVFIWMASHSPGGTLDGQPRQAFYFFVIVGSFAAIGDVRLVMKNGLNGVERVARHLWRMCVALFIAAGSFFLGQQKVFPASMRGSPVFFVPEIIILVVLLFWLYRVFSSARKRNRLVGQFGTSF
jgi:hypothetical protein